MEEKEKEIYLHVDPYCGRRQVIHIESIAGSNMVFTAKFNCEEPDGSGKIKLKSVEFETYPMFGLLKWGFKKIIPQIDSDANSGELREIKIIIGFIGAKSKDVISFEGVSWNPDDTIDNKIVFEVFGKQVDREGLKDALDTIDVNKNIKEEFKRIPVDDRPCQFKLVTPML